MSKDTTTQSPDTESTFPHLSWRECELHFDSLLAVFLLMLMTPSIVSFLVTWRLVGMLLNVQESVSTRVESVVSTVKSEVAKSSTLALFRFSKNLNRLSDAVLKTASAVDQLRFTFQSGIKK